MSVVASAASPFTGGLSATIGGRCEAEVDFLLNADEHGRRKRHGLGAETRYGLLDGQLQLNPEQRSLECPLVPTLLTVKASTWKRGLVLAGRLAGLSARVVYVPQTPRETVLAALEYGWYGVGLRVGSPDSFEEMTVAAPFAIERFTATGWQFAERIYGAWLTQQQG